MTYWVAGAAAVGALVDKKNPLRGAALGAGTMMTGGALAGAAGAGAAGAAGAGAGGAGLLAGSAGAAGGASGFMAPATASYLTAPAASLGTSGATSAFLSAPAVSGAAGSSAAAPGLLATMQQYKPMFDAAQTGLNVAESMRGQGGQPAPAPAPAPMTQSIGGNQLLNQIAMQGQQQSNDMMAQANQARQQRRMARRGLL